MNFMTPVSSTQRLDPAPATAGAAAAPRVAGTGRVLRNNTYALLSMTLLFSAAMAAASATFPWPAPGVLLTLGGYFGLLFAVYGFKKVEAPSG